MNPKNLLTVRAERLGWLALLVSGLLSPAAWAGVGVVTHVSGVLVAHRASGQTQILAPQSEVEQGDTLASEANTFARIRFNDGGNLLVRPNSRINVASYRFDKDKPDQDAVNLNLVKGGLRVITGVVGKRSMDKHLTTTATATIGIRGTHYGLQACQSDISRPNDCEGLTSLHGRPLDLGLHIDVLSGAVVAENQGGTQVIGSGQFGYVRDAQTKPELVPNEQGFRAGIPPSMTSSGASAGTTVGLESNDNICIIK